PAVSPERSNSIASVICNAASKTISVTFTNEEAFRTAVEDWRTHLRPGFLLITYVAGCGSGTAALERSFHLVSKFHASEKDLCVVCEGVLVPIHQTVHRDEIITVHAATYEI
ncbi:hypothetical protein C8R43DRAFT_845356, partial [Mycena crocata]